MQPHGRSLLVSGMVSKSSVLYGGIGIAGSVVSTYKWKGEKGETC